MWWTVTWTLTYTRACLLGGKHGCTEIVQARMPHPPGKAPPPISVQAPLPAGLQRLAGAPVPLPRSALALGPAVARCLTTRAHSRLHMQLGRALQVYTPAIQRPDSAAA